MGESSSPCLMRSFSQPSSSLHDSIEGDPICALTSSISFGRYMSESLAWEKWSAFTHDRYMEEVEKCSRPGSVAKMKAYFEAHYKKKAAERAALREQQNVAANSTYELMTGVEKQHDSPMEQVLAPNDDHVATECKEKTEVQESDIDYSVAASGFTHQKVGREFPITGADEAEQPSTGENPGIPLHLLKNVDEVRQVRSVQGGATSGASATSHVRISGHSSTESTVSGRVPKPPAPPKPPTLPKPTVSLPNRPNVKVSPSAKRTAAESSRRREAPRSLHMSINFASRETKKPLSPILEKIVNSRLVKTLVRASKDRTTHQASVDTSMRPPSVHQRGNNSVSKSPSVCERKARTPIVSHSFSFKSEERAAKRKEFFERLEQQKKAREAEREQLQLKPKEKSRCNNKETHLTATLKPKPYPTVSHGTQSQNHTIKKDKAICYNKEMHFLATPTRPSNFSQGTESPRDPMKKVQPLMRPSSSPGRKTPSKLHDITSRPPWRITTKMEEGWNDTKGKISHSKSHFAKVVSMKTTHENSCPNIQL